MHADARRAAVEEILRTVPGSVALHHDLTSAADSAVHRTVRDAGGLLGSGDAPLVNDCACCALREDLVPELLRHGRVAADGPPAEVVTPALPAEALGVAGGERIDGRQARPRTHARAARGRLPRPGGPGVSAGGPAPPGRGATGRRGGAPRARGTGAPPGAPRA
ncbi:hypothetical protein ACFWH4_29595, partial [Streptomyces sp. NPDC127091]